MESLGKKYVSWATEFDAYQGSLNWQNLSLSERTTIVEKLLTGEPGALDLESFVMSTKLRKIQYDGLTTVIIRTALMLDNGSENLDYLNVLPHLSDTALGQELISLMNKTATDETTYRMGELEFLAQSGSRSSPLDKLLGLPKELQIRGLLQLLKSRDAFTEKSSDYRQDPNKMSFNQVLPLINQNKVRAYANYSGSLHAASAGLIDMGTVARLTIIGFMALPILGLGGGFFISWWLVPAGIIGALASFKYTRRAASQAVLRKALSSEIFFDEMRRKQVLWLEFTPEDKIQGNH